MATRGGRGGGPQQTPAGGAVKRNSVPLSQAHVGAARAQNAPKAAPAGTQAAAAAATAPQKPPRVQPLGAAQPQGQGQLANVHTQPSTSQATKGEPLPEIPRESETTPSGPNVNTTSTQPEQVSRPHLIDNESESMYANSRCLLCGNSFRWGPE